jgi:hypothetical protein
MSPDGSFSLQEGGQSFSGSYSVTGSVLRLHIVQLQKDVEIAIQGDRLVVNGEETWTQPNKVSESPVAAPSTIAKGLERNLADLANDIEAGREVSLPIKYNSAAPDGARYAAIYACCGNGAVYMADGVVTLSKTTLAFRGTVGANDFNISPGRILELANQPEQSSRLHVKVAVKNKKGDKENKKDYYFYNAGAIGVGEGTVGGPGASIICSGCDDSINLLYVLLTRIRDRQ